ncbi:MAG TPA: hypothetical protein VEC99_10515 [Clostridia bacterium]|nr:hypothetical protein [Clostridia bacterium]
MAGVSTCNSDDGGIDFVRLPELAACHATGVTAFAITRAEVKGERLQNLFAIRACFVAKGSHVNHTGVRLAGKRDNP